MWTHHSQLEKSYAILYNDLGFLSTPVFARPVLKGVVVTLQAKTNCFPTSMIVINKVPKLYGHELNNETVSPTWREISDYNKFKFTESPCPTDTILLSMYWCPITSNNIYQNMAYSRPRRFPLHFFWGSTWLSPRCSWKDTVQEPEIPVVPHKAVTEVSRIGNV